MNHNRYKPYQFTASRQNRKWPDKVIDQHPIWCSIDLRDGNQALPNPMDVATKLKMFKMLCAVGFKEIEVSFPTANDTEYAFTRLLIEGGHIPDDVTIQIAVPSRDDLIRKSLESIKGVKKAIINFYNPISDLQRKIVFKQDMKECMKVAQNAARLIKELAEPGWRIEYTAESSTGAEAWYGAMIGQTVALEIGATSDNPLILNLPATVELCYPNQFADRIEFIEGSLVPRHNFILSVHPHNDRGTAVAAAEQAVMAGAQRVEGCLFGNGERTGNVDIVTIALNLMQQGVDPGLDLSDLPTIRATYEECTGMIVHERHPYAGELVFTAFSGGHQDAIKKGFDALGDEWNVPYLHIDPKDIGRSYDPVIRINNQSGKGGVAYIIERDVGVKLSRDLQIEFSAVIKNLSNSLSRELSNEEIVRAYLTWTEMFEDCQWGDI